MFHLTMVVKCLMESSLLNNRMKMIVKIFTDSDDAHILLRWGHSKMA